MIDLVLVTLATWYLSYAITATHGPGGVFAWVRDNVWHGRTHYNEGGTTDSRGALISVNRKQLKNGLLDCPVCLAFWAALILLLVPMGVVVQALALAGAAMLMHGLAGWRFGGG